MQNPSYNNLNQILNQAIELLDLTSKINQTQIQNLIEYIKILQKWNKVYNLTAITKEYDILIKHIIDCLAVLSHLYQKTQLKNINSNCIKILDVGSGAGLPAIIWAIANPAWKIYSIDAVQKKISFQQQTKLELKLDNLFPHHIRIQDLKNEKFNIITARAYANTNDIIQQTLELLDNNGFFALLKGKDSDEFNLDKNVFNINKINIQPPFLEAERHLVIIELNKKYNIDN